MKEITVKSEINNITSVTARVDTYLKENDVPKKVINQFNVAIDELFSNICYYAYEDPGDIRVMVVL